LKNLAIDLSVDRFNRRDKQTSDFLGTEATSRGRVVSDRCLPGLVDYLKQYRPHGGPRALLWDVLFRVELDRLAVAILSGAIRIIGRIGNDDRDTTLRAAWEQIGTNLECECRSARLLKRSGKDYARLGWDIEQLHRAGGWGADMLMQALPGMFEIVLDGPKVKKREYYLQLSAKAEAIADGALWACVRNNPHHMPAFTRPEPWTSETRDGEWGERQYLVNCRPNSLRMEPVRRALAQNSRPWLDALNKLESVPYRINEPMLRFVQQSYELATADNPHGLDFLFHNKTARTWRRDHRTNKRRRATLAELETATRGNEITFRTDIMTAQELLNRAFYVPMNFDTRGRVYAIPNFNFTRGDHIRCLFEFDEGKPLGEIGLYWLKVHVANCAAGFKDGKPGNLTFDERVQWVNDRIDELRNIGRAALAGEIGEALLSGVDDRFQFARACIEIHHANNNPEFESHLPLLFDASSSGLQHFCMLMHDQDGGQMVNLVPNLPPQDVYKSVADRLDKHSGVDYDEPRPGLRIAKPVDAGTQANAAVFGRKFVKRAVMTRFYGSERYGITNQLLEGKFGLTLKQAQLAAKAIIGAVDQILHGPAKAMQFIQSVAKLLAEEHKSLHWITPAGFPWQSRYHAPNTARIKCKIAGRNRRITVTIGDLPEVIRDKSKDSSAPNLVQGLDAAHLQLVALSAGEIPLVTVHDCFGCLAADAAQFRATVHDRLAQMYIDHPDVLGEVLKNARRDLSPAGRAELPALPKYGNLIYEDIRNAQYITG
jgi:DNA-directed RNA polymerase